MSHRILAALSLGLVMTTFGFATPAQACQSSISLTGTVNGSWTSSCTSVHRSGRYARYYTFTVSSPTVLQIDLVSSVDTYLYLLSGGGTGGSVLAQDDDGGDGLNSRLNLSLAPGTYTIEATTYSSGRNGSFTLTLRSNGGNCLQTAPLNASTSGSWTSDCASAHRSGRYAKYYSFTINEQVSFRADLISSAADPYLFLLSGSGTTGTVLAQDDDSGDGNSARITRTLSPGTYTIEATTYSSGRTGSFALLLGTSGGTGSGCISSLALDSTTSGTWTSACASTHRSNRYARYYTFSLSSARDIQIDLTSSVDSYLYLMRGTGTNGTVLAQDDDAGGNGNARIRANLLPGSYTIEATTYSSGQTGSFGLSAGRPLGGLTVFLVHGLSQSGGALDSLARTLSDPQYGIDLTRFQIDSGFNWGECANRNGCSETDCEVSDGGRALARYINSRNPSGPIILIGYSLGGLISRDMVYNNYDNIVTNRRVAALITLGTPNVGYPYCEVDENFKCDILARQMASHYRLRQNENLVVVSDYLFNLNDRWGRQSFVGLPGQWLAAAGTFCSEDRFCEWNALDNSLDQGCQDNNPQSDGVVCAQSALFRLNLSNTPTQRWQDANYAHIDNWRSWTVMCGNTDPSRLHALFNPPANGTLVRAIKDLINSLR